MKLNSLLFGAFLLVSSTLEASPESNPAAKDLHSARAPVTTLKLDSAKSLPAGAFEFRAHWGGQSQIVVESSPDLKNWQYETLLPADVSTFTDSNPSAIQKFYRARDYVLRIQGTITDIESKHPVAGATVTISFPHTATHEISANSDAEGFFQLHVLPMGPGTFKLVVEKSGYDSTTTFQHFHAQKTDFTIPLSLAPPGYRPLNDDFANRATLQGTNLTVEANTFAATPQDDLPLTIFYGDAAVDYPLDRWWTWTAPIDGAVLIELDQFHAPAGVVVYTGELLQDLVRVWDSSDPDDAFSVHQGVQYHIAFGTYWAAQTRFTLTMVEPVPPSIRLQPWPGNELVSASQTNVVGEPLLLSVRADGTKPLTYQWRKDGIEIPNATNSFFVKQEVALDDGGAYSVAIANQAGAILSDEIPITVLQERPHLSEIMQGTWTQETSWGSAIVTFTASDFTAEWEMEGTTVSASGSYRLTQPRQFGLRLVMTYTEGFPGDVDDYTFSLTNPAQFEYLGSITHPGGGTSAAPGTFTRLAQP